MCLTIHRKVRRSNAGLDVRVERDLCAQRGSGATPATEVVVREGGADDAELLVGMLLSE